MNMTISPAALCAAIETASGHHNHDAHIQAAASTHIPDAASQPPYTMVTAPRQEPFTTNVAHHPAIEQVLYFYRLRQDMIRARTKLSLQGQASLRRLFDGDKERAASAWSDATKDETHELRGMLDVYISMLSIADKQQAGYEKHLVKAVKGLPIYQWAKGVKGLGDLSLACIIGEASGYGKESGEFYSVGDFKSVSALWKRMGLAVLNGHRQGAPGKGATAEDWIVEGYSKTRRSVMWNVGNSLILSMGKFRPLFGEDVRGNPEYTELQCVFAERARYEAERLPHKCGASVKESKTGKDSYTLHAANRAKRYTEKRLLRMLYSEWRRSMG
ncbi:hypothetical protein J0664_05840 [Rhizobium leguminosarum]|uniref:hypothetical protein n=1 Tax=Rhizobium leguminosarum TaxID=384 RepID=UPI001A931BB1|nr:hypothetical protein [Rhizobium leguminosarum]MBY5553769.1 hypothetical protein [Rhizobium leguminosarum]QSW24821.1 hypothetical protein J0664_05840 [Rhizobium leguminosarum]